jgi:DNA-binding transcriptional LysR family regulator
MTLAAKELHLTQSGVSQHIHSLEEVLGLKLFDRIKKSIVPTRNASLLFDQVCQSLGSLESTVNQITGQDKVLTGEVSIGIPIEFGNHVVMPLIAQFGKLHPGLKFTLRYGFATEMNTGLLSGRLDLAFIDEFTMDATIELEKVFHETHLLCAEKSYFSRKEQSKKPTRELFESYDYIDYQPGEPLLRRWFEHHLGIKKMALNTRATLMDVQGVARLIRSGLGIGILPNYLVDRLDRDGVKLHVFEGSGKPLRNKISIASLKNRTQSAACHATHQWIKSQLLADAKKSAR